MTPARCQELMGSRSTYGIGAAIMRASVAMFGMAFANKYFSAEIQLSEPGASQNACIGRHSKMAVNVCPGIV